MGSLREFETFGMLKRFEAKEGVILRDPLPVRSPEKPEEEQRVAVTVAHSDEPPSSGEINSN